MLIRLMAILAAACVAAGAARAQSPDTILLNGKIVTLAGISLRNGILKVSHFLNLGLLEGVGFGDDLVLRGSRERLTPVLTTALAAAFALLPLLAGAEAAGKEILHPVAVVVFGGLISATLLDTFLTPLLFRRFGGKPLARLMAVQTRAAQETAM